MTDYANGASGKYTSILQDCKYIMLSENDDTAFFTQFPLFISLHTLSELLCDAVFVLQMNRKLRKNKQESPYTPSQTSSIVK